MGISPEEKNDDEEEEEEEEEGKLGRALGPSSSVCSQGRIALRPLHDARESTWLFPQSIHMSPWCVSVYEERLIEIESAVLSDGTVAPLLYKSKAVTAAGAVWVRHVCIM